MSLTGEDDHGSDGGRHRRRGSNTGLSSAGAVRPPSDIAPPDLAPSDLTPPDLAPLAPNAPPPPSRRATGPGRVNLIGDHTDYNGGLAIPMAIGMGVTATFTPDDRWSIVVRSESFPGEATVPLDLPPDADAIGATNPPWARLVAAMVALARPESGGVLELSSTVPAGSGLSSSAALAVALCAVFGIEGSPQVVASVCQTAEHLTGVPVGIMDPLVCAGGRRGHALLIDFATLTTVPVRVPDNAEVVVVHCGEHRALPTSPYAARVAECEAAAALVGPLGALDEVDLLALRDPVLRRRARHVLTECRRVRAFVDAFDAGDLAAAGDLMIESHRSLADDFEVSTPALDALVASIAGRPGVYGVRLTGAGFGGCVVALCRPGALLPDSFSTPAWRVAAADGTLASAEWRQPGS
jgi:galactokinase